MVKEPKDQGKKIVFKLKKTIYNRTMRVYVLEKRKNKDRCAF